MQGCPSVDPEWAKVKAGWDAGSASSRGYGRTICPFCVNPQELTKPSLTKDLMYTALMLVLCKLTSDLSLNSSKVVTLGTRAWRKPASPALGFQLWGAGPVTQPLWALMSFTDKNA